VGRANGVSGYRAARAGHAPGHTGMEGRDDRGGAGQEQVDKALNNKSSF
jgi:hypothetical protein